MNILGFLSQSFDNGEPKMSYLRLLSLFSSSLIDNLVYEMLEKGTLRNS